MNGVITNFLPLINFLETSQLIFMN